VGRTRANAFVVKTTANHSAKHTLDEKITKGFAYQNARYKSTNGGQECPPYKKFTLVSITSFDKFSLRIKS
jgi:hypothetical protein